MSYHEVDDLYMPDADGYGSTRARVSLRGPDDERHAQVGLKVEQYSGPDSVLEVDISPEDAIKLGRALTDAGQRGVILDLIRGEK